MSKNRKETGKIKCERYGKSCIFIEINVKIWYHINMRKDFSNRSVIYMINDKICALREKLNKSIIEGEDYEIVYKISTELDDLIASYYSQENSKEDTHKSQSKKMMSII